jgi:hypothetical protein
MDTPVIHARVTEQPPPDRVLGRRIRWFFVDLESKVARVTYVTVHESGALSDETTTTLTDIRDYASLVQTVAVPNADMVLTQWLIDHDTKFGPAERV